MTNYLDLTSIRLIEQKYTYKLKKLLEVIYKSKPFELNYSKIATLANISQVKLYDYISYLNDGQMLLLIEEKLKGLKKISKPAKIYFNNTNLLKAYCQNSEVGTIKETFFANQISCKHNINIAKQGDFLLDSKYTFKVGGKNKIFKQIKDLPNSYVVADDIEFGFLY